MRAVETEQNMKEKVQKGDHAARIMDDPMVKAALGGMREVIYNNIRTSHFSNKEEREYLYLQLKAIDHFEKQFTDAISGGKKARLRLIDRLKGKL